MGELETDRDATTGQAPTTTSRTLLIAFLLALIPAGCERTLDPEGPWESVWCDLGNLCAIDAAGVPTCWSESYRGSVLPTSRPVVEISVNLYSACGVDADGAMQCWHLGGTPDPHKGTDEPVYSLSRSCGLKVADGTPECWDDRTIIVGFRPQHGPHSQLLALGDESCLRAENEIYCTQYAAESPSGIVSQLSGQFEDMAGSGETVCGLREGEITCVPPNGAPTGGGWTQLAGRGGTQCAIDSLGRTECWGSGNAAVSPILPMKSTCDGTGNWRCGVTVDSQEIACWGALPDWLDEFEVATTQ